MDVINLTLYKEAQKIAEKSNGEISLGSFYSWLLEVKNVNPDIEAVLLKKAHGQKKKHKYLPSDC